MNIVIVGGTADDRLKFADIYGANVVEPVIVSSLNAPINEMVYSYIGATKKTIQGYGKNFVGDITTYEVDAKGMAFIQENVKKIVDSAVTRDQNPYESALLKSNNFINSHKHNVKYAIVDVNYKKQLDLLSEIRMSKKVDMLSTNKDLSNILSHSSSSDGSDNFYYNIVILESKENDLFDDSDLIESLKDTEGITRIDMTKSDEDLTVNIITLLTKPNEAKTTEKGKEKEEKVARSEEGQQSLERPITVTREIFRRGFIQDIENTHTSEF